MMDNLAKLQLIYIFYEQVQQLAAKHSGLFLCPIWSNGFVPPCLIVMRRLLVECRSTGPAKPFFFATMFYLKSSSVMIYTENKNNSLANHTLDYSMSVAKLIRMQNIISGFHFDNGSKEVIKKIKEIQGLALHSPVIGDYDSEDVGNLYTFFEALQEFFGDLDEFSDELQELRGENRI